MDQPAKLDAFRPSSDVDPFSDAYLTDPYTDHARLRDAGPIVWLDRWGVWAVARFAPVRAILGDHETFCSGAGVGMANIQTGQPWRTPSLLLETDPPNHTRNRAVLGRVLSPASLRQLRRRFEHAAERMVSALLHGHAFDAVPVLAEAFPMRVFADAVGVPNTGRHNLLAYGNMVFNTMGPPNALYEAAMCDAEAVIDWVSTSCRRDVLSTDGLGAQVYAAADGGTVTEAEAGLIVRSFLSAGVDTTANGIGNALACLIAYPDQWDALRAEPSLARSTFEEVMRFESPFQTFFRTATRDVTFEGCRVEAGDKVMLSLGAANRDPRLWTDPDRFDIRRKTHGHVGFGFGIHGCVGQMIARLEVEVLLAELARRVARVEPAGEPVRALHNTLRGFRSLPVRLIARDGVA